MIEWAPRNVKTKPDTSGKTTQTTQTVLRRLGRYKQLRKAGLAQKFADVVPVIVPPAAASEYGDRAGIDIGCGVLLEPFDASLSSRVQQTQGKRCRDARHTRGSIDDLCVCSGRHSQSALTGEASDEGSSHSREHRLLRCVGCSGNKASRLQIGILAESCL